jgi:hypothetical protein
MTKKNELLNLFKKITGKTTIVNAGALDDKGQAAMYKKFGYQTANAKDYVK